MTKNNLLGGLGGYGGLAIGVHLLRKRLMPILTHCWSIIVDDKRSNHIVFESSLSRGLMWVDVFLVKNCVWAW